MSRIPPQGIFESEFGVLAKRYNRPRYFVASGEFRPPKKGEYFLSGAVITAYLAVSDMTMDYWIAKPVQLRIEASRFHVSLEKAADIEAAAQDTADNLVDARPITGQCVRCGRDVHGEDQRVCDDCDAEELEAYRNA